MKIRELMLTVLITLILASALAIILNGAENFRFDHSTEPNPYIVPTYDDGENDLGMQIESTNEIPLASMEFVPQLGSKRGSDFEDVLLLYDSGWESTFDINFCKIAEYYGLKCKMIALNTTSLSDELLRDEQGNYFQLIGISARTLLSRQALLNYDEIDIIKSAIEKNGIHFLISKGNTNLDPTLLVYMTDGAVQGFKKPPDLKKDWLISTANPELTREFTGQIISSKSDQAQLDYAVQLSQPSLAVPLILSTDDEGSEYPIFIQLAIGDGSILIDAGDEAESLEETTLRDLYYSMNSWNRGFAQIIPTMLTFSYALGDETWHVEQSFVNLTIDDPALSPTWENLDYSALLLEMVKSQFHTTIAMYPVNWRDSDPDVITLFKENPNYYSLVQQGNNGDGYEFYKYSISEDDEYEGQQLPARPFSDQEADIQEALSRMTEHRIQTGLDFDKIMVFPWGISPENTLLILKKYNYLATVNEQDLPLDATLPSDWDYGMYPAILNFGNFPILTRRYLGSYQSPDSVIQPFLFDLFIGKPALFYSEPYEDQLFSEGIDGFNLVADRINQLSGDIEWQSLGYILKLLHQEKNNDDGSVDVRMYTNHLILTNDTSEDKTYHISKEETLNIPISKVVVNGQHFPYKVEQGFLTIDLLLPKDSSTEILITYNNSALIPSP